MVRKTFDAYDDLRTAVYTSLVRYLEEKEYLRLLPFDAAFNRQATLDDIDPSKVELFVNLARDRRNFPIPFSAGISKILTHLNLMAEDGKLTNPESRKPALWPFLVSTFEGTFFGSYKPNTGKFSLLGWLY